MWEGWAGAEGDVIISYTRLTVNANSHALMSRYQQPGNEKRMLAILNEGAADAWHLDGLGASNRCLCFG